MSFLNFLRSNPFYTLSWRSAKILISTFGVPLILALCWVLLPLGEVGDDPEVKYVKFGAFSCIMWFVGHLAWLTFYDCIIPGCSKILLVFTTLLFLVSCTIFLWFVSYIKERADKFVYITPQLLSFFWCQICYTIHILTIRRKVANTTELGEAPIYNSTSNQDQNDDFNNVSGFGSSVSQSTNNVPQQNVFNPLYDEEATSPRLRSLSSANAGTNRPKLNLDQYMAEQFPEQKPSTSVVKPGENGEEHRWSEYVSFYLCFMKSVDTKRPAKKAEWVPLFSLAIAAVYRGIIELTFIWLLIFSNVFLTREVLKSSILAFLSVIIFQGSRIFITRVLLVLNELLPRTEETQYFTFFSIQALYFLFYRSLFVQAADWAAVIAISIGTFMFSMCYSAAHMLHSMYYLRYFKLPEILECMPPIKLAYVTFLAGEITYEKHTGDLIIEYYYEELSEYFSVIVFFIFMPTLRQFNSGWYPSLTGDLDYTRLMLQYLYLFCFEFLSDCMLRLIVKKSLNINITHEGRERTIRSYRTRFLFSLFILYMICFTYLSLMDISDHISQDDEKVIYLSNTTSPYVW